MFYSSFVDLSPQCIHTQPVLSRFVKHLQLMSNLHFRLGDAERVVNGLCIPKYLHMMCNTFTSDEWFTV